MTWAEIIAWPFWQFTAFMLRKKAPQLPYSERDLELARKAGYQEGYREGERDMEQLWREADSRHQERLEDDVFQEAYRRVAFQSTHHRSLNDILAERGLEAQAVHAQAQAALEARQRRLGTLGSAIGGALGAGIPGLGGLFGGIKRW